MGHSYLQASERIAALRACAIAGTGREPGFDNLVFTAAQVMRAPVAVLGLVGTDQVWIKGQVGPVWLDRIVVETLCRIVVESSGSVAIEDIAGDARFEPQARAPKLQFAAAVALVGPGAQRIGCLAVMDYRTRTASERQMGTLRQLGVQGSELLQLRVPGIDVRRIGTLTAL